MSHNREVDMDVIEKIKKGKLKGYLTVNKRIIFEEAIYHITQRAPGREILFINDADNLYFLKLLKETVKKFNLELFCFALLPNHVHFLLQIHEENLSQAMKNLFERYAWYFNLKYKRKGHVFCGRYRASLCCDENYFLAVSVYIHLNPCKARLCQDIKDYRWSSVNLYLKKDRMSFVNYQYLLFILDKDSKKAKQQYFILLQDSMNIKGESWSDISTIKKIVRGVSCVVRKIISTSKLDSMISDLRLKVRLENADERKKRKYIIQQLLADGFSPEQVMKELGISKATFYR